MPTSKGTDRRTFLRWSATAAAATAVPGLLAACGRGSGGSGSGGGGDTLKIGLLLPLAGTYASLGEDMRKGFETWLDEHDGAMAGRTVELVVEDTEANPEVGLRKAQKVLGEDGVDLVSGIVSSAVALGVRDLFHERRVPLVISNAGANDLTRSAGSPYIFRTSFSNWQTSYSIGAWAAENLTMDGMYVMAPDYAAGHEDAEAFREAYEGAGGTILDEAFPPFGTTQDYQPFLSTVRQSGAKGVFAFFAGGEAIAFVQQYRDFGLKDEIPLIGTGFLTDEGVLPAIGDAALGMRTSLHYAPLLDNPANTRFIASYTEQHGEAPTVYSVQSYDAAALIDAGLRAVEGSTEDVDALVEAMAEVGEIDSPRGTFRMDPKTRNPVQTFYLREVQEQADGSLANVVLESLGEFADPG